jgi:ubiquinone/menaquinone biosynthesis C-methylase UbiE
MDAVVHALSDELAGRAPCLEVGVGTGRIALPLARAGVSMVGLDTSRPMLAKLLEKSGGAPPFPLVQADAVHMPWRTDAFGAAIACHVLHLIPKWGDVLTEVARIVRRRGPFMVSFGEPGSEWMRAVNERFAAAAGLPDRRAGAQNADEVAGALTTMGARVRALPTIEDVRRISVRRTIADLEAGLYSNTWSASAETRGRAARDAMSRFRSSSAVSRRPSPRARICTANTAALRAPPIATVATGTPGGICTHE